MSYPLKGMARVICAAPHDPDDVCTSVQEAVTWHGHQASAAWAYALARLEVAAAERSSGPVVEAIEAYEMCCGHYDKSVATALRTFVRAFARQHGLEAPDGE